MTTAMSSFITKSTAPETNLSMIWSTGKFSNLSAQEEDFSVVGALLPAVAEREIKSSIFIRKN